MKFVLVLLVLVFGSALFVSAPKPKDNRPRAIENCSAAWKDSGYKWRLRPYTPYMNSEEVDYWCQVNVNGRWVDSQYVKVG